MKIKFTKKESGEISATIKGDDFSPEDYITMIKELKKGEGLEVEFEGDISKEEQGHINSMIEAINDIEKTASVEDEETNSDDMPF
ncbi:hypothetical protein KAJ41_01155 [Candidatus Parcubacteria bacterium]|nr:hypothetical protein [Candidatus Parcubacteria bacterium]